MKRFFAAHPTFAAYAIAPLMGLALFHALYDLPLMLNLYWGLDAPSDWMQHITGYYAFRASPWGLPLLHTNLLGFPEGASIAFTDSIPLLALPFKALAPILALIGLADFQPIKLWLLLAFLLQPLAAVYLIRSLGYRDFKAGFFAAAFALLVKWLIFRVTHPALTGQFVILLALALYVQTVVRQPARRDPKARALAREWPDARLVLRWVMLLCLTFLIHLYLFVMVLGIFAAAALDFRAEERAAVSFANHRAVKHRAVKHRAVNHRAVEGALYKANLLLLAGLLFPVLYGVFIGASEVRDLPPAEGFGYFSLNLAGPLVGGNLIDTPARLAPTAGQAYEDQSYLGLGVILLLLVGLFLERRRLLRILRRAPILSLLMLGFFVFALSSEVYLGAERVFQYPAALTARILESPLSQFRASARFFWPVGYAVLFFGLAAVLRKKWALPVLALLLVIQWVDLPKPYTPRPAGYAEAFNLDLTYWDALLREKRALYLYPTWACGGDAFPGSIPILMMAAKNGAASNTVPISRSAENCAGKLAAGRADIQPGSVHIFTRIDAGDASGMQVDITDILGQFEPEWCAARAELILCVPFPTDSDRALLARVGELEMREHSVLELP